MLDSAFAFDLMAQVDPVFLRVNNTAFNEQGVAAYVHPQPNSSAYDVLWAEGDAEKPVTVRTVTPAGLGNEWIRSLAINDGGNLAGLAGDRLLVWNEADPTEVRVVQGDVEAPSADLDADPVTSSSQEVELRVTYADNLRLDPATLDSADVRVATPEGASLPAELVSVDPATDRTLRRATYRVQPPVGGWATPDFGSHYTVYVNADQVADASRGVGGQDGNFMPETWLGVLDVELGSAQFLKATSAALPADASQEGEDDPDEGPLGVRVSFRDLVDINQAGLVAVAAAGPEGEPLVVTWNGEQFIAVSMPDFVDSLELTDAGNLLVSVFDPATAGIGADVRLYQPGLDSFETLVSGEKYRVTSVPSISRDGKVAAFVAIVNDADEAQRFGVRPGSPGVFVSLENTFGREMAMLFGSSLDGKIDRQEGWVDLDGDGQVELYREGFQTVSEEVSPYLGIPRVNSRTAVASRLEDNDENSFTVAWESSLRVGGQLFNGVVSCRVKYDSRVLGDLSQALTIGDPSLVTGVDFAGAEAPYPAELPALGDRLSPTSAASLVALNAQGQVLVRGATEGQRSVLLRANEVRRPLLFVHGIFGSFPTENVADWLLNRGVPPERLQLDPLANAYQPLLETLQAEGYQVGVDLFPVVYDWRLNVAPHDGSADGVIKGFTPDTLTDEIYDYGVDYFGRVLRQAAEKWKMTHPSAAPLEAVDVIAHSMGGLVARSYVQSSVYGGETSTGLRLPRVNDFISLGTPYGGAAKAWNPLRNNFGDDGFYIHFLRPLLEAVLGKLRDGEEVGKANNLSHVPVITRDDLTKDHGGLTMGEWLVEAYCPSTRDLMATFDFLDRTGNLQAGEEDLERIDAQHPYAAFRNELLLDLSNNYNPSDREAMPVCDFEGGCRSEALSQDSKPDPNPFASLAQVSAFYAVDILTGPAFHEVRGELHRGTLYPMDADTRLANDGETWWRLDLAADNSPNEPIPVFYRGDGTVPRAGSILPLARDLRIRTHAIAHDSRYVEGDPAALFTGESRNTTHMGIVSADRVQRQVLATLGRPVRDDEIASTDSVNPFEVVPDIVTFRVDPVEAFLVDAQGNRLGWSEATGPLQEIPNSLYVGDENGFGWIFDPPPGPLELRLRGLGGEYLVEVSQVHENGETALLAEGDLAPGEEKTDVFDVDALDHPWRNAGLPHDVNDDGEVNLGDLIAVVTFMRNASGVDLPKPPQPPMTPPPYVDINGDDRATLADLLEIVSELRRRLASSEGEMETPDDANESQDAVAREADQHSAFERFDMLFDFNLDPTRKRWDARSVDRLFALTQE